MIKVSKELDITKHVESDKAHLYNHFQRGDINKVVEREAYIKELEEKNYDAAARIILKKLYKDFIREDIKPVVELGESEYKCKKCNSKRIITNTKQLRSCDEGATTIYSCNDCGYTF